MQQLGSCVVDSLPREKLGDGCRFAPTLWWAWVESDQGQDAMGMGMLLCLFRTASVFPPVLWDLGMKAYLAVGATSCRAFHGAAAKAGVSGECGGSFQENPGKLVLFLEWVEGRGRRCLPPSLVSGVNGNRP